MGIAWSIAGESHNGTPASHWWQTLFIGEDDAGNDRVRFLQMVSTDENTPGRNADALDVLGGAPISKIAQGEDVFEKALTDAYGDALRVPIADEDSLTNPGHAPSFTVDTDGMEIPPEGTVLVGIIDDGIGFANRRFRLTEDTTRFLYLWQQGQIISTKGPSAVPMGKEYLERDLNAALATGAGERQIYRDLDMVNPKRRALAKRATHGSSVADMAAGAEMGGDVSGKPASEVRLLGVNLPVGVILDGTGTYLDFFAILGLMRIMDHVEALEAKASAAASKDISYPVVVNFSFGLSSGAPDPNSLFARQVDAIHDKRKAEGKAPMTFIVPAGNQREARTLGKLPIIPSGQAEEFIVRVPIHSASSAVFEVTAKTGFDELQADLIAPQHAGAPAAGIDLADGQFSILSNPADPETPMAAVYRTKKKLMFMIAPTRPRDDAHFVVAQPGHWRVRLRAKAEVTGIRVQINRGDTPGAQFYQGYQSRLIDRPVNDPDRPNEAAHFIQTEGTLNTLAAAKSATIAQALRGLGQRDPVPARYSGLPHSDNPVEGTFVKAIAETSPSLDGRSTTGLLSGTRARLGGTSIAAAVVARQIVAGKPLS